MPLQQRVAALLLQSVWLQRGLRSDDRCNHRQPRHRTQTDSFDGLPSGQSGKVIGQLIRLFQQTVLL
jgi:hypothetical protein